MKKLLALSLVFFCMHNQLKAQTVVPLYNTVPNSKPSANEEKTDVGNDGISRISKVSVPAMVVYKAANPAATKTAVIICPGGGYGILAWNHEGENFAKRFNEWGITAFVLKYRLPSDVTMLHKEIGPLQDAQRAIQMVRENAAEWGVDPNKIGIMGFSAGGHLASTASTHFSKALIENPKNTSVRPDFSLLIYPVISFTDSTTHMGSRNNLLGPSPSADKIKEYSNELQVTAQTPPAFLVHASDDKAVIPQNSIYYYEALLKYNTPAELHIYQAGGHGFGIKNKTTSDDWTERMKNWLVMNGWL
ncbi:alpha/beta hydrolase [Foetidibacter luteolus]|uniref:alpha/beta hydrolase n=1 Tax=Foetidibacter luteolus TaxID=2608880 RepID=UPI00129B5FC4|nr:alpha/beta hydrolase [Foetidibacter luteolus]